MNEQTPKFISPDEVKEQVERYLNDESIHLGGSVHGNSGNLHSHSIHGGSVHRERRGFETTSHLETRGNVDGQNLTSDIVTTDFGVGALVKRANTSDNSSQYHTWAERTAGVSRKTENGDKYVHQFKDPAKIEKASKLITSLASKRAARVVEPVHKKVA